VPGPGPRRPQLGPRGWMRRRIAFGWWEKWDCGRGAGGGGREYEWRERTEV
jgi:hypothetical protein